VESDGTFKAFASLIVTSETYRQSARREQKCSKLDPVNEMLARTTAYRMAPRGMIPSRMPSLVTAGLLNGTSWVVPSREVLSGPDGYIAIGAEANFGTKQVQASSKQSLYPPFALLVLAKDCRPHRCSSALRSGQTCEVRSDESHEHATS